MCVDGMCDLMAIVVVFLFTSEDSILYTVLAVVVHLCAIMVYFTVDV